MVDQGLFLFLRSCPAVTNPLGTSVSQYPLCPNRNRFVNPPRPTSYVPHFKIGDANDAYWGGDRGIPQNRPSYQINDTKYLRTISTHLPSLTTLQPRNRCRCFGCRRLRLLLLTLFRPLFHLVFFSSITTEHFLRRDPSATRATTVLLCSQCPGRTSHLPNLRPDRQGQLPLFWLRRRSFHSCAVVRPGSERFIVDLTSQGVF